MQSFRGSSNLIEAKAVSGRGRGRAGEANGWSEAPQLPAAPSGWRSLSSLGWLEHYGVAVPVFYLRSTGQ
jgi:hypothetical protein